MWNIAAKSVFKDGSDESDKQSTVQGQDDRNRGIKRTSGKVKRKTVKAEGRVNRFSWNFLPV